MKSLQARGGYVLVMTLGLLVLAATLLVGVGRASVRRALEARLEQAELQRRWGTASCRQAVLPYASEILARAEAERNRPVPVLRASVELSGRRYDLIVADEQAKANVNALLERGDKRGAEARIREAMSGSGLGNALNLRPEPLPPRAGAVAGATSQPAGNVDPPRWISGFGQVFDDVGPERLLGRDGNAPVERLTCWGSGAVNLMRVSDASLRLAASPLMSNLEIGRLIDARNAGFAPRTKKAPLAAGIRPGAVAGNGTANLDAAARLLAEARVDPKVRRVVAVTSTSTCFSLWVVSRDGRRAWYRLYVSDASNPKEPHVDAFAW